MHSIVCARAHVQALPHVNQTRTGHDGICEFGMALIACAGYEQYVQNIDVQLPTSVGRDMFLSSWTSIRVRWSHCERKDLHTFDSARSDRKIKRHKVLYDSCRRDCETFTTYSALRHEAVNLNIAAISGVCSDVSCLRSQSKDASYRARGVIH